MLIVLILSVSIQTALIFCGNTALNAAEQISISVSVTDLPASMRTRSDLSAGDLARMRKTTVPTSNFSKEEPLEAMAGGAATSRHSPNRDAFSHSSANLGFEGEETFKLGNALFRKLWTSSPSPAQASGGLGPLFNARACQSCHLKDGRGHPPEGDRDATSMFLRLARPPASETERQRAENLDAANFADPVYGGQFQDRALQGLPSEGRMRIAYEEFQVTLARGAQVFLRQPAYSVSDLAYGPMGTTTTLSPRIAPPMIGMGLIQAIHPADLVNNADEADRNKDGISGRVALARDPQTGVLAIGRFGWKAENTTVRGQSAGAFAGDLGISTPDVPRHHGDCTANQPQCLALPTGVQPRLGTTEAPDPILDLVTFYSENLAVPQRRDVKQPDVLRGKAVFYKSGCHLCHTPKFVTRRDAVQKAHAFQLIWPYSDFLLHDMGDGLADGQQVGVASGTEWRTPPLWGLGLTEAVSGHTFFLHDGRARNLTEAVLWHGGEAQAARDNFSALAENDRAALIEFLGSL